MFVPEDGSLTAALTRTRARLANAAAASGRSIDDVRLLAVSKQQPVAAIRTLAAAGQKHFGESYPQEALPKLEELRDPSLVWHFIGQLQTNKTRAVAENFHWVHTVNRLKIAQRLNDQRPRHLDRLEVCIQVKLAEESGKGGVAPQDIVGLATAIVRLPQLRLRGLMCIPPPTDTFDAQKAYFDALAGHLRSLQQAGLDVDTLSMGMSTDLEAAVAAGATWVRIGTAIFGARSQAAAPGL